MKGERHTVVVEVNASGAGEGFTPNITGPIHAIRYIKDDYADGVDFTVTLEATGQSLWTDTNINASETVYPVAPANLGSSGAASTLTEVPIIAVNDRVRIQVANGGNATSGRFDVVVG